MPQQLASTLKSKTFWIIFGCCICCILQIVAWTLLASTASSPICPAILCDSPCYKPKECINIMQYNLQKYAVFESIYNTYQDAIDRHIIRRYIPLDKQTEAVNILCGINTHVRDTFIRSTLNWDPKDSGYHVPTIPLPDIQKSCATEKTYIDCTSKADCFKPIADDCDDACYKKKLDSCNNCYTTAFQSSSPIITSTSSPPSS